MSPRLELQTIHPRQSVFTITEKAPTSRGLHRDYENLLWKPMDRLTFNSLCQPGQQRVQLRTEDDKYWIWTFQVDCIQDAFPKLFWSLALAWAEHVWWDQLWIFLLGGPWRPPAVWLQGCLNTPVSSSTSWADVATMCRCVKKWFAHRGWMDCSLLSLLLHYFYNNNFSWWCCSEETDLGPSQLRLMPTVGRWKIRMETTVCLD